MFIIMGLILVGILAICIALYHDVRNGFRFGDNTIGTTIACLILWAALIVCPIWKSYSTYVEARVFYDGIHEQYRDTITMYADRAVIDAEGAFTDFRYKGYQKAIAGFISDLRYKITKYNTNIISKRVMKRNLFFSWYIVAPDDDMKPLALLLKKGKR